MTNHLLCKLFSTFSILKVTFKKSTFLITVMLVSIGQNSFANSNPSATDTAQLACYCAAVAESKAQLIAFKSKAVTFYEHFGEMTAQEAHYVVGFNTGMASAFYSRLAEDQKISFEQFKKEQILKLKCLDKFSASINAAESLAKLRSEK